MMMAVRAMHVPVRQLFVGGGTNFDNAHIEIQHLAGKRMIAVNGDMLIVYRGNCNGMRAMFALCVKAHAGFDFLLGVEHVARHLLGH